MTPGNGRRVVEFPGGGEVLGRCPKCGATRFVDFTGTEVCGCTPDGLIRRVINWLVTA